MSRPAALIHFLKILPVMRIRICIKKSLIRIRMERYESRSGTLTVNVQKHAWAKKLNYFYLSWTFSNIFLIFYTIYNLRYFLSIIKYGHKALINFQKKIEIGFC